MKRDEKFWYGLLIFAVLTVVGATLPILAEQSAEQSVPQQVIVRVDGASCPFCAFGLEECIDTIMASIRDMEPTEEQIDQGLHRGQTFFPCADTSEN